MTCIACKRANMKGPWSEGTAGSDVKDLRFWFVLKHSLGLAHKKAVKLMLQVDDGPLGAPEAHEFATLLQSLRKGGGLRSTNVFGQMSDKTMLMTWVLQEAMLNSISDSTQFKFDMFPRVSLWF